MGENETPVTGKPFSDDDKIYLFLAYFGILSLIPFFMFKDKRADSQKEYIYWHARQGLALALTVIVLCVPTAIIMVIPFVGWILGCLGWVFIMVVAWGGMIMGWVKGFRGEKWPIPVVSKIAEMFN